MMGTTHAVCGAAAFLAVASLAHPSTSELAFGVAVAAGAALTPDIDHPNASVSRTFGPFSEAIADVVAKLSGGHRHATHTLVATAAVTAGMWAAGRYDRYTALACVLLLVSFAAHTGKAMRKVAPLLFVAGIVALVVRWAPAGSWEPAWLLTRTRWAAAHVPPGLWLPTAVGVGYLSHLIVDMINQPLPMFLWPIRAHVGIRGFRVSTFPEYLFAAAVTAVFWWEAYGAFAPAVEHWAAIAHRV